MATPHEADLIETIARLEARIARLEGDETAVPEAPPSTRRQLLWAGAAALGGVAAATLPSSPAAAVNGDPMKIGFDNNAMTIRTDLTAPAGFTDSVVLEVSGSGAGGAANVQGIVAAGRGLSAGVKGQGGSGGGIGLDGQGGSGGTGGAGVRGVGAAVSGAGAGAAGVIANGGPNSSGGPGGPGLQATGGGAATGQNPGAGATTTGGTGGTGHAAGLVATGKGNAAGVESTGGTTSGPGVRGTGGAPNGHGVFGIGTGTGYGIGGSGGAGGGIGVNGVGGAGGDGVVGIGGVGDTNGVTASGSGLGAGLQGLGGAGGGPGAWLSSGLGPQLLLQPKVSPGPPGTGTHAVGEIWLDSEGVIWVCTAAAPDPGTWRRLLTEVPANPTPAGLVTLLPQPVRLLSAKVTAGTRTVGVAGQLGIPSDAVGVVVNLSTTKPKKDGTVRVFPSGAAPVAGTPTLTYAKKANVALGATVRLGTGGAVVVGVSGGTTRVNLDATAYIR